MCIRDSHGADLRINITHPTDPALSGSVVIGQWFSSNSKWNIELFDGEPWGDLSIGSSIAEIHSIDAFSDAFTVVYEDVDAASVIDTLHYGVDIAPNELQYYQDDVDLIIISPNVDSISLVRVRDHFEPLEPRKIEEVTFSAIDPETGLPYESVSNTSFESGIEALPTDLDGLPFYYEIITCLLYTSPSPRD